MLLTASIDRISFWLELYHRENKYAIDSAKIFLQIFVYNLEKSSTSFTNTLGSAVKNVNIYKNNEYSERKKTRCCGLQQRMVSRKLFVVDVKHTHGSLAAVAGNGAACVGFIHMDEGLAGGNGLAGEFENLLRHRSVGDENLL